MAGKYYAIRKGSKTGLFTTWEECKHNVSGYSGAEYKSFKTKEEAVAYLEGGSQLTTSEPPIEDNLQAIAYVDGSYNIHTKEYSYGAVLLHNGEEFEFSEKGPDTTLADMRNVAGEILGAQKMMAECMKRGIIKLDIYYDYEGIEKWCTGAWQARKPGTIAYKAFFDQCKEKLSVNFHKVAAHTGVELNERVDKLAKAALGIQS